MSFGKLTLAILLPPVYFFIVKKPILGVVYSVLLIVSVPLLFLVIGFFLLPIAAIHAIVDLAQNTRREEANYQARKIAEEMSRSGVLHAAK